MSLPDLVRKVCDLSCVPDTETREVVLQRVARVVNLLWEGHRIADDVNPDARKLRKDIKAAMRDIVSSHARLQSAATSLLMSTFRLGDIYRPIIKVRDIFDALEGAEHANVAQGARLEILRLEMELLIKISDGDWGAGILRLSECKPRGRGRPSGRSRTVCHLFVSELLEAVEDAGGRLTFNKAYPDKGTLMPALRLLSECLPPGVIPKKLPPSRIADICAASRRGIASLSRGGKNRRSQASKAGIFQPITRR
jgi:hypothetical protein